MNDSDYLKSVEPKESQIIELVPGHPCNCGHHKAGDGWHYDHCDKVIKLFSPSVAKDPQPLRRRK